MWKLIQLSIFLAFGCASIYYKWPLTGPAVSVVGACLAYWFTLLFVDPKSLIWGKRPEHWVVRARKERSNQGVPPTRRNVGQ